MLPGQDLAILDPPIFAGSAGSMAPAGNRTGDPGGLVSSS
ncbi:hypothetical protein CHCC15543_4487 [Bacillus licheniformis]|nr:hypothetical protein CHCC15543_4487 [Bacillus licheniformis]